MAQRYMYVRVPVEQGLAYMIKTRLEWMESEKKAEIVVEDVNELCFEKKPIDVLERLNKKKCKLLVWSELPSSLQSFDVPVLVGDLIQTDNRRNKNEYHLRQTSSEDQVILQWVCSQDIQLIDQKRQDIELVQLSQSINNVSSPAGPVMEKGREVKKSKEIEESESDGADDTLGNSNYEEPGGDNDQ